MAIGMSFTSASLSAMPAWLIACSRRATPFNRGVARFGYAGKFGECDDISIGDASSGASDPNSSNIGSVGDVGRGGGAVSSSHNLRSQYNLGFANFHILLLDVS